MSTTPETERTDDQLVTHLSHWLTRQIGNDELLRKVQEIDTGELDYLVAGMVAIPIVTGVIGVGQTWLSNRAGLSHGDVRLHPRRGGAPGDRAQLEVAVRETVETLVYGD